jgi:hypothetical protein
VIDSNDKLRRQLLGRNYKKVMAEKERQKTTDAGSDKDSGSIGQRNQRGAGNGDANVDNDDYDEDEGRTASIGKKSSAKKRKVEVPRDSESTVQMEGVDGELQGGDREAGYGGKTGTSQVRKKAKGRKKATSFLDEILAERSQKRKKR